MITEINESKSLAEHVSCDCRCRLDDKRRNTTTISVNVDVKNSTKPHVCRRNYKWNLSICARKCDKNCDIKKMLKSLNARAWMQRLVDNLVVTHKGEMLSKTIDANSEKENVFNILFYC